MDYLEQCWDILSVWGLYGKEDVTVFTWDVSMHKMCIDVLNMRRKNPLSGNKTCPTVHFKEVLNALGVC